MLVVSCGIGLFYGFVGQKHTSSDDFLLGGSRMGTFPMAMSLAARLVLQKKLPYVVNFSFQFYNCNRAFGKSSRNV
jgi:hypothetical protein